MLLTYEQCKFLGKYLESIDSQENDTYIALKPDNIPPKAKKRLLGFDEHFFRLNGYHMIKNYEELIN